MSKIMDMPIKFGVRTYVRTHVRDVWQLLNPEFLSMLYFTALFFKPLYCSYIFLLIYCMVLGILPI